MAQPGPNARRDALLALGVTVEGASEYMDPHAEAAIWPLVDTVLADQESGVRRAVLTAIGSICEWLEDAAAERLSTLLPALLSQVPGSCHLKAILHSTQRASRNPWLHDQRVPRYAHADTFWAPRHRALEGHGCHRRHGWHCNSRRQQHIHAVFRSYHSKLHAILAVNKRR